MWLLHQPRPPTCAWASPGRGPGPPGPHRPQVLPLRRRQVAPHGRHPGSVPRCPRHRRGPVLGLVSSAGSCGPTFVGTPALPVSPPWLRVCRVGLTRRAVVQMCCTLIELTVQWVGSRRGRCTHACQHDGNAHSAQYMEGGWEGLIVKLRPAGSLFTEGAGGKHG